MKAQDFIIGHIQNMVSKFPYVQCIYQYDLFDSLHSIKILPEFYLNNPKELSDIQYNITKEFLSIFPYESICFFSKGSFIEIEEENVLYRLKGNLFRQYDSPLIEFFTEDTIFINVENQLIDKSENNYALAA